MTVNNTLPERTATPAELDDVAARIERARTGQQLPRTLHALCEQAARLVNCGHCWARPGTPCVAPGGYHLARFARASVRGLMAADEFAVVLGGRDVFDGGTLIVDGQR